MNFTIYKTSYIKFSAGKKQAVTLFHFYWQSQIRTFGEKLIEIVFKFEVKCSSWHILQIVCGKVCTSANNFLFVFNLQKQSLNLEAKLEGSAIWDFFHNVCCICCFLVFNPFYLHPEFLTFFVFYPPTTSPTVINYWDPKHTNFHPRHKMISNIFLLLDSELFIDPKWEFPCQEDMLKVYDLSCCSLCRR